MNIIFVHVVVGILAFAGFFVLVFLADFFAGVADYWRESALTEKSHREAEEDMRRCRTCEMKVRGGK